MQEEVTTDEKSRIKDQPREPEETKFLYKPYSGVDESEVDDPVVRKELKSKAEAGLKAHSALMSSRIVEVMRSTGTGLALFFDITPDNFKRQLEENKQIAEDIGEQQVNKILMALEEKQATWKVEEMYVSPQEAAPHLTDLSIIETDEDRRQRKTHYWIRDITNNPTIYSETPKISPHDQQLKKQGLPWKAEPYILGKKSTDSEVEAIGFHSTIERESEEQGINIPEYLKQKGYNQIFGVEARSLSVNT